MSTYIFLECLDHDPPIQAEDESGQHLYDLPRIRAEVADREATAADVHSYEGSVLDEEFDPGAYFRCSSARFLAAHPNCRIGIRDEYGVEHPLTEEER